MFIDELKVYINSKWHKANIGAIYTCTSSIYLSISFNKLNNGCIQKQTTGLSVSDYSTKGHLKIRNISYSWHNHHQWNIFITSITIRILNRVIHKSELKDSESVGYPLIKFWKLFTLHKNAWVNPVVCLWLLVILAYFHHSCPTLHILCIHVSFKIPDIH